jgi:hypothetical protein
VADALRALPAERIVAHVADAARRWCDADLPARVRVTGEIERRLGYSTPVVEYALDRLFSGVDRTTLVAAIAGELGSVSALDGPVERPGLPPAWARGAASVAIVSSETTIGVALVPAIFALCAKCDVTVKDRSDALIAAFLATLAEEDPAFARCARADAWSGGDDPREDQLFARADVVVAFGGDDALRAIRARCGAETRFVPFGRRTSVGRLTAGDATDLDDARADRIVRDALLYDGEGCLSLHALFVDAHGAELARAAALLRAACERVALEFPGGKHDATVLARTAAYRNAAAFRAANGGGALLRGADAVVVIDPPLDELPPLLPRVLPVYGGGDDALSAYVERHRLPVQALAVGAVDAAAVALAARIGAVRVAPFGALQSPPLASHHGGSPRIADFVRWIDGA